MKISLVVLTVLLSGCAHLVQFTGASPDPAADEAFARELDRLDAEVRACYAKVVIIDPVPLELAVDESGGPLAARAVGPLFGSTLGGCLETVAFRANLGAGPMRRLGRAIAHLKPAVPVAEVAPPASPPMVPVPPR
jgi:hypothetical protein